MEVRQSSGQRLSGEQLQSSQVQLSHSQSGLLQLDTGSPPSYIRVEGICGVAPTFLFITAKELHKKTTVPYEIIISFMLTPTVYS